MGVLNRATIEPGSSGYLLPANRRGHKHRQAECPAVCDGYGCTRPLNHKGKHAAHGFNDIQYATWDR